MANIAGMSRERGCPRVHHQLHHLHSSSHIPNHQQLTPQTMSKPPTTHPPSAVSYSAFTISPSELSLNRRWYNRINAWTYNVLPGPGSSSRAGTALGTTGTEGKVGSAIRQEVDNEVGEAEDEVEGDSETLGPGESASQAGVRRYHQLPPPPHPGLSHPAARSHTQPLPITHSQSETPKPPLPHLRPSPESIISLPSVVPTIYPKESISVRETPRTVIRRLVEEDQEEEEKEDDTSGKRHDRADDRGGHPLRQSFLPLTESRQFPKTYSSHLPPHASHSRQSQHQPTPFHPPSPPPPHSTDQRSKGLSTAELKALRGRVDDYGTEVSFSVSFGLSGSELVVLDCSMGDCLLR